MNEPVYPTVDDLRSAPLVHRFADLWNPPALTNFLGCVQADLGVVGIRSVNFPPFATGDVGTGGLFVNRKYFPATGAPVTYVWRPDRIEREAEWDGLRFRSTTFMAKGAMAVIVLWQVENLTGIDRRVDLRLSVRGGPMKYVGVWDEPAMEVKTEHAKDVDPDRRAVVLADRNSAAVSVQGTMPLPDFVTPEALSYSVVVRPGQRWRCTYVTAIGETEAEALATYDAMIERGHDELRVATEDWNAELAAMFTPGNDRWGGSLPLLETDDEEIRRLYLTGAIGVGYFKRDTPWSVMGRTYDTLMPRYWQSLTFLWDYSLSSLVHGLLDPVVMRNHLEMWMAKDVHTFLGTEWLTGEPIGQWYAVNDFAMLKMARDYLRFSGDLAWLDRRVSTPEGDQRQIGDLLLSYAGNWRQFRTPNGLADYGGIDNLLECVSTYVHEVAGMNAANVYGLRFAADLIALFGDLGRAGEVQVEAKELAAEVMRLYAPGAGHFNSRMPDGRLVPIKHAYDVLTVLTTMPGDLSLQQWEEMASFIVTELQTPTWMHALSCDDNDATFSVRPDHQWTGAYTAWPAIAVQGLYNIGKVDWAFAWLKGLSRTAYQGPFGQAHFADAVIATDGGGARKASADLPYITDWACSSAGAWCDVIVESIFGVNASLASGISAEPRFGAFDPDARLRGLAYQGKLYDVDRDGLHPAG